MSGRSVFVYHIMPMALNIEAAMQSPFIGVPPRSEQFNVMENTTRRSCGVRIYADWKDNGMYRTFTPSFGLLTVLLQQLCDLRQTGDKA